MDTHTRKQSELSVIVKAKDLCSYVLMVTEKSPKRFRFTLTSKLQTSALNVLENLFRANEVFLEKGNLIMAEKRESYQQEALTECKLLAYLAQLAMEQQCILPKQYEQITKKVYDVQNMIGAWMKSDKKRME